MPDSHKTQYGSARSISFHFLTYTYAANIWYSIKKQSPMTWRKKFMIFSWMCINIFFGFYWSVYLVFTTKSWTDTKHFDFIVHVSSCQFIEMEAASFFKERSIFWNNQFKVFYIVQTVSWWETVCLHEHIKQNIIERGQSSRLTPNQAWYTVMYRKVLYIVYLSRSCQLSKVSVLFVNKGT